MSNWLRSPPGFIGSQLFATVTTSTNSKGSYSQLTAATPWDATAISIAIGDSDSGTDRCYLIDVAVGAAGSEKVIIENLLVSDSSENYSFRHAPAYFPLSIPAGTRLSCRGQRSGGETTKELRVYLHHGGAWADDTFSICHTMGANTADSGGTTLTSGGTTYTFGSYAQLTASSEFDCEYLLVSIGNRGLGVSTANAGDIEVAVGAASSEQRFYLGGWYAHSIGEHYGPEFMHFPFHVPAGSRISARCSNASVSSSIDLVIYGLC